MTLKECFDLAVDFYSLLSSQLSVDVCSFFCHFSLLLLFILLTIKSNNKNNFHGKWQPQKSFRGVKCDDDFETMRRECLVFYVKLLKFWKISVSIINNESFQGETFCANKNNSVTLTTHFLIVLIVTRIADVMGSHTPAHFYTFYPSLHFDDSFPPLFTSLCWCIKCFVSHISNGFFIMIYSSNARSVVVARYSLSFLIQCST